MSNHFLTTKHFYKVLCCFISLLLNKCVYSQINLVPNPSFEQYTNCPVNFGSISNAKAAKADIWYKPDIKGASYYTLCTNNQPYDGIPFNFWGGGINYQVPKTGDAYFAMYYYNQNGNNYIQVKLYDSLKAGKTYYCQYYVSLINTLLKGCNNIAMLFTRQAVYADTTNYPSFLQANPQIINYGNPIVTDTMGWVKISGIFTAQGGEQYLTLGNFKLASQTLFTQIAPFGTGYNGAGYYVDDVSVMPLDSFCLKSDAGRDTAITLGDSVFIGSYTNGIDSLKWLNGNTTIDSTRPGFWVKPTVTTSYVLQQVVNGCFSADTVVVTVGTVPLKMINYKLLMINEPSLRGTKQSVENFWTTANEVNVSHFNVQRSTNDKDFITIGKVAAQNKNSNEYTFYDSPPVEGLGVVYYRIESIDFDGKKQYSEIRTLNIKPQTLNGVGIFPNPAKEFVTVECKGAKELMIVDYLGRTIVDKKIINNQLTIINVQRVIKGIYVVKAIMNNGEIKTEKLIVE